MMRRFMSRFGAVSTASLIQVYRRPTRRPGESFPIIVGKVGPLCVFEAFLPRNPGKSKGLAVRGVFPRVPWWLPDRPLFAPFAPLFAAKLTLLGTNYFPARQTREIWAQVLEATEGASGNRAPRPGNC